MKVWVKQKTHILEGPPGVPDREILDGYIVNPYNNGGVECDLNLQARIDILVAKVRAELT